MENMAKTQRTEKGADSLAKITLNTPEFICPICLSNKYTMAKMTLKKGSHNFEIK